MFVCCVTGVALQTCEFCWLLCFLLVVCWFDLRLYLLMFVCWCWCICFRFSMRLYFWDLLFLMVVIWLRLGLVWMNLSYLLVNLVICVVTLGCCVWFGVDDWTVVGGFGLISCLFDCCVLICDWVVCLHLICFVVLMLFVFVWMLWIFERFTLTVFMYFNSSCRLPDITFAYY